MTSKPLFWRSQNLLLLLFYAAAVWLGGTRGITHPVPLLAIIAVVVHVLELPVAFRAVAERGRSALATVVCTTLFGFTWWLPVRRGVY